jgi:hypothetical protein
MSSVSIKVFSFSFQVNILFNQTRSTKLEIRAKYFLPGSKGVGGRGKGKGEREDRGKGGKMTQTLYAHMNKRNKNK